MERDTLIGASLYGEQDAVAGGVAGADLSFAAAAPGDGLPLKDDNGSDNGTVSVAASGDQRIDGLLAGIRWSGAISYSDPDSVADYQADHPEFFTNFQRIGATQLQYVHATLSDTTITQPAGAYSFSVEGFTNLSISYAGAGSGVGTIRLANTDDPGTAYAYYPSTGSWGGDVFFGPDARDVTAGNYGAYGVIHELGHALGLKHGHETDVYGALPYDTDSMEFSVMTYKSYVGSDAQFVYNEEWGYAQSFMMYDIAALQYMYGADFTLNAGNTVYTWSPTSGESYVNGALAIDPGANRIFETVWDGNGTDTYDLSNYATALRIDLAPGGFSVFSDVQRADLGGGPNGGHARGNVFNALQYRGDARSLIENAIGGSGADAIGGNAAANTLTGNGGNDTLSGNGGNDTLDGGDGNDSLGGSDGNDRQLGGAGNDTVFSGNGNDTALGGAGDDSLSGGGGADSLAGEAGNDALGSGEGKDTLVGGAGQDRFDFNLVTESPVGATCDILQAGGGGSAFDGAGAAAGDRIDLLDIDANTTAAGDQAFVFGGTGKGHVWCVNSGTTTRIFANVDNDAAAEFQLDIQDGVVLASAYRAADFIL